MPLLVVMALVIAGLGYYAYQQKQANRDMLELADLDKKEMENEKKKEIEDIKNLDYVIYETKAHRDAIIFVKEYITEHPGEELRFYACGGDGTLFEVINGASGASNVEISCVPVGSGNDFLKYFGVKLPH